MYWDHMWAEGDRCKRRHYTKAALVFALAVAMATAALGAPSALLIGVSYKGSANISPLEGIDLDVDRMEQVARDLGIANIRRLWDREATLRGIRTAMQELAEEVGPDDLTLIYFSGHGTQVPDSGEIDEVDGQDESLLPFDARLVRRLVTNAQGQTLNELVDIENDLIDDEFYEMLGRLRSNRVLLVIDSCNSGTIAKSIGVTPKFIPGPRRMTSVSPGTSRGFRPPGPSSKFIGIMAAQDHEYALATDEGSVLTNALHRSISAARSAGFADVTVQELYERVSQDVAREMSERFGNHPQHPNLFVGPDSDGLKGLVLQIGRVGAEDPRLDPPADDPLINRWMEYADRAGRRVELTVPRQVFTLHPDPRDVNPCDLSYSDHLLSIEIEAPADGYMNVLNVGQGEQDPIVLFPNGYSMEDSRVQKGERIVIPPLGADWCLPASDIPLGMDSQWVLIVAAFSTEALNFYRDGTGSGRSGAFLEAPPDPLRCWVVRPAIPRCASPELRLQPRLRF